MTAATADLALPPLVSRRWPTFGGWLLFALGLSLGASAIRDFRPEVAGLSLHPYVLVMLLGALPALFHRPAVPVRRGLEGWGLVLLIGIALSFLMNQDLRGGASFLAKWATMGLTFWTTTRLVRTRADFFFGVYGMLIAVGFIAIRGVMLYRLEPRYYMHLMPGIGSRNVFSLWTLAPVALGMWLIAAKATRLRARVFLTVGVLAMTVPQILSLSRSGWVLIVATVGLVMALRRSLKALFVVGLLAVSAQIGIEAFGFEEKLDARMTDLQEGTTSDSARGRFIQEGLGLFIENPIFGVGQRKLPYALGRRMQRPAVESHNMVIDMLAGTGLAGIVPLLVCVFVMLRRWYTARRLGTPETQALLGVLPVLFILVFLRGMTTNEIVYNPAVIIGLALAFAACNLAVAESRVVADSPPPSVGEPEEKYPHTRAAAWRRARQARRGHDLPAR